MARVPLYETIPMLIGAPSAIGMYGNISRSSWPRRNSGYCGPGTLVGAVLNQGDAQAQVGFLTRAESEAGGSVASRVSLGSRESKPIEGIVFAKVPSAPGTLTDIYLVTSEGKQLVSVPVLAPTGMYEQFKPKA